MGKEILKQTKQILEKLGLNSNQIKFYLALLELGQASLPEIIKKSGLARPTAYRAKQELEDLQLIAANLKKYKQQLSPVSPKRLLALAGNRQRKMRRLELEIKELLPGLNLIFQDKKIKPRVELFDDEQGYIYLANQSLESQSKEIYLMGNLEDLYNVLGKDYDTDYYIPTRLSREIKFKWLVYKNKDTIQYQKEDAKFLRETRFINPKFNINATMMVYDHTVVFFSSYQEKIALSIASKYLAEMQKTIFEMLWSAAGAHETGHA